MQEHPHEDTWREERERLAAAVDMTAAAARAAIERRAVELNIDPRRLFDVVDSIGRGENVDLSDVLAAVDVWNARDRVADVVDIDDDTYRDVDGALTRVDGAPFDPTWSRPRVDGPHGIAVRGARRGHVIGSRDHATTPSQASPRDRFSAVMDRILTGRVPSTRLSYVDVLALADGYLRTADGATYERLIGTDTYSWHHVVVHRPHTVTTADGATYAQRPEGSGASVQGTARPTRSARATRSTAHRYVLRVKVGEKVTAAGAVVDVTEPWTVVGAPIDVHVNGWWPMSTWRILKVYATTTDGRTRAPRRRAIGRTRTVVATVAHGRHGKYVADLTWRNDRDGRPSDTAPSTTTTTATVRRVAPTAVDVVATAVDHVRQYVDRVHGTSTTSTVRYRTADGTTIAVTHEDSPRGRRYRIAVSHRHAAGSTVRQSSTVRNRSTVATVVERLAVAVRP